MSEKAVVKCCVCHKPLDKTKGEYCKHIDTGKNKSYAYAHVECAAKTKRAWQTVPPLNDSVPSVGTNSVSAKKESNANNDAFDVIHGYLKAKMGDLYSKKKVQRELDRMVADGKEPAHIFEAIKYWCEVQGKDFSEYNGSLSILDYIYGEAKRYYEKKGEYKELNVDKTIQQSLGKTRELTVHKKKYSLPYGTKMFDLE